MWLVVCASLVGVSVLGQLLQLRLDSEHLYLPQATKEESSSEEESEEESSEEEEEAAQVGVVSFGHCS